MIYIKNKGFCLFEVLVGISILVFGSVLLSSLLSQTVYYTVKTKLLMNATERAIFYLDQQKSIKVSDGPYQIVVHKQYDKQRVAFCTVNVSWNDNQQTGNISFTTVFRNG